ncbi:core protein [Equine molluscum contagiosum-like virus]|nr:core protein [Equine molluscum contagiosum-like virus]
MFVDDNSLVVLARGAPWPAGLVAGARVLTACNARAHVRVSTFDAGFDVDETVTVVCLVNPSYVQLLQACVFLRRRAWAGKLLLLFERRRAVPRFPA